MDKVYILRLRLKVEYNALVIIKSMSDPDSCLLNKKLDDKVSEELDECPDVLASSRDVCLSEDENSLFVLGDDTFTVLNL